MRPLNLDLSYNETHDSLHSFFSSSTGFAFTLFAFSVLMVLTKKLEKAAAVAIGLFATLLSILIFVDQAHAGIYQRIIFMSCFGWMIYFYRYCEINSLSKT
jgi:hypothetical protein